ncbi:PadR family transcriptional regulator [Allorhizocola rhizosphaerae]|uniref:PadR family transcriptional regulator n=1 Tax=Allorhizocola rhizosphaerae TaxID=1872709 RepID=UPI003CCC6A4E
MLDVLEVLIQSHSEGVEVHGWAVMKAVGRTGPTVYGVLDRLEDMRWVTGRWEDSPVEGKPRRRVYRLTPNAVVEAGSLLASRRPVRQVQLRGTPTGWPGLGELPGGAR